MPFTFNGFGTAYRGQKDVDENDCYVTTLFIVAAFLPIVPLASYIVRPHGGAVPIPMARIQGFDAVKIKMDFRQVLSVYLRWYVGAAVGVAALFLFMWTYIHFLYPDKEKIMKHTSSAKVVVASTKIVSSYHYVR